MHRTAKIYVAGHNGLLGSALMRRLAAAGFKNVMGIPHNHLDLCETRDVMRFFHREKPEYVFLAAARVGGVCSNGGREAEFLTQNLQIQMNVIEGAHRYGTKKLLFMGSACVYPRLAPEPVAESSLLTGPLEPSNEWYAIAKIAGVKLCQAYWKQHGSCFISCMPTNLYGPGDKYDLQSSHVLPALIRKFHEAKMAKNIDVTCWGSGTPTREFLYSDDCADACVLLMRKYNDPEPVNIGGCPAISISALANAVAAAVDYDGRILWDCSKPDGTPRRAMDGSKLRNLGWYPQVGLASGLLRTYSDFTSQQLVPHAKIIYDNHK